MDKVSLTKIDGVVEAAIERIKESAYGEYLMSNFPVRVTSATKYPEQNKVLERVKSPACTDGKEVYVSPKILGEYLSQEFNEFHNVSWHDNTDGYWEENPSDTKSRLTTNEMVSETMDILLHEYTHAINEHVKLGIAAEKNSEIYQRKLQVACELQANDGIMGRNYALNRMQLLPGVTNKRLHPETIGRHTLASIMASLKLNESERQGGSMANAQGDARKQMAKASGAYEHIKQEIEEDKKEKNRKEGAEARDVHHGMGDGEELEDESTDSRVKNELQTKGLQKVKELLLASMTDKLKYDACSNCVIYNDVRKRVRQATYARPSKRMGMYGSQQHQLLKKGTKIERIKMPDKTNTLTVLAVDASGSMSNQQEYVAGITDDLLKQTEEKAKELGIELHYENLLATLHTSRARSLMPVVSDAWKSAMRNYVANGGNDFTCVLREIDKLLYTHDYDAITVINVSDGMDVLVGERIGGLKIADYVEQGKVKWIDALVSSDTRTLRDAAYAKTEDTINIREQLLVVK